MLTLYIIGIVVFSIVGVIAVNLWVDERGDSVDKDMRAGYSLFACMFATMWPFFVPLMVLAGVGMLCYKWVRTRLDSVRVD